MASNRQCRLRRKNDGVYLFHTKKDIDAIILAHNRLVDYCELLELKLEKIERQLEAVRHNA